MPKIYFHKISAWIYIRRWDDKKNFVETNPLRLCKKTSRNLRKTIHANNNHVKNNISKKIISLVSGSKAVC